MKKTLLLLCALMMSATMSWAQNDVTAGASIYPLGGFIDGSSYSNNSSPTLTQTDLNHILVGDVDFVALLPQPSGEGLTNGDAIQGFFIDFGSSKSIGSVQITWQTDQVCASAFKIYLTDTQPSTSTGTITSAQAKAITVTGTAIVDETSHAANPSTFNFTGDDVKSGRYLVFQATAGRNPQWGVKMKKLVAYDNAAASLNTFTISPSIVVAGESTDFTVSALDNTNKDYASVSYTLDGAAVSSWAGVSLTAGTHTIVATDDNDASNTVTKYVYAVATIPAAKSGSKNLEIYTASATPTWNVTGTELTIDGQKAMSVIGNSIVMTPASSDAISNYNHISVAVFPVADCTGGHVAAEPGNNYKNLSFTGGEWNIIDYDFTTAETGDVTSMRVNLGNGDTQMLIANAVLYYKDPNAFTIDTSVENVAKITGAVTATDVTTINAADVTFIDLTGISSITSDAISAINPLNPNALVSIPATDANTTKTGFDGLEAVKNAVRVATWVFPVNQLDFTDANGAKWWTGEGAPQTFISTNGKGYKITRSVAGGTGKYISVCPHAAVDLSALSGVKVYQPTDATSAEITFTEQAGVTTLNAETPYILHVSGDVDLVASATGGDFYAHKNGGEGTSTFETTIGTSGAKFVGTWADVKGDGSTIYALQDNVVKRFKTTGIIGSFRAYFTNLPSAGASEFTAIFMDADNQTTGVATIKANGEIEKAEVYNLAGQRVENAQKGVFIVNGKKVVLK